MRDPEIDAMASVTTALADLDTDARGRVLRWAADRYSVSVPHGTAAGGRAAEAEDDVTEAEIAAEAPTFGHFAELVNACHPKTDVDKALVAGYWFQSIQGRESFQSQELTRALKNLGHTIKNITDAVESNIQRKPARILQLAKSGSAKQARKTFKLTHEGLVFVQGMMAAAQP